jgi:Zn-dependent protease with chaperone function
VNERPGERRRTLVALARLAVAGPSLAAGLAAMALTVALGGLATGAAVGLLLAGVAASSVPGPLTGLGFALVATVVGTMAFLGFLARARSGLRRRRRLAPALFLLSAHSPAGERETQAREALSRLARQVDVPEPSLRVVRTDRPLCATVGYPERSPPARLVESELGARLQDGSRSPATRSAFEDHVEGDAVVVVSTGLLATLSAAELDAVLAHELAHLRNGDLRLVGWLLLPVAWAAGRAVGPEPGRLSRLARRVALVASLPGVVVFNRGREFAADRAAAALTSPASLASALERLDPEAATPSRDLRSVAVLNVVALPGAGIPFSHPSTERRVERLRAMAD